MGFVGNTTGTSNMRSVCGGGDGRKGGGGGGLFVCYDGVGCVKWNPSGTLRIGIGNHF